MDFFVRHWAPIPRRFPHELPVLNVGDIHDKSEWVRRRFSTCNFSFILRGTGEFRRLGKTWKVKAPCVLTQWPGELPVYGPQGPTKTWNEIFLIYDARSLPVLRRRGFISKDRPIWKIENIENVLAQLEELRILNRAPRPAHVVDHVDRLCERLILDSLLPARPQADVMQEEAPFRIEALLRRNPEKEFDFDQLSESFGLSSSSLRRQWNRTFPVPPQRYLSDLRMQKARRLLIESSARVGEIAHRVGYEDVLYFSRRFHQSTGMAPSAYRKRYCLRPVDPDAPAEFSSPASPGARESE
jgi:AraC-like DNA-binding protein